MDKKGIHSSKCYNLTTNYNNNFADKGFPYSLEVTTFKVGCKSGTLKKDWEKVLSLLK